jgi:hypothetical protein
MRLWYSGLWHRANSYTITDVSEDTVVYLQAQDRGTIFPWTLIITYETSRCRDQAEQNINFYIRSNLNIQILV